MSVKRHSSLSGDQDQALVGHSEDGAEVHLTSPTQLPHASGFLWNKQLLARFTCRGYAQVQFMQPEPTSYSRGPVLEATTFLQPELGHYAHHPGRFVYIRDDHSGEHFSVPYEPVRRPANEFRFTVGDRRIDWHLDQDGLIIDWSVELGTDDPIEIWTLAVQNSGASTRELSIFPVFSIGYLSWLSQEAGYSAPENAIVARAVPPYQKLDDYPRVRDQKTWTFLSANETPTAYETVQALFEGEGGLANPDALKDPRLGGHDAAYETPIAAMQFGKRLESQHKATIRLIFGATDSLEDIQRLREKYLKPSPRALGPTLSRPGALSGQRTPERRLDHFTNHWLVRQVNFHGELNRLTTDPQTRNFLQDALGQLFIDPERTARAIRLTLSQQQADGGLPDGVLLTPQAELKYINQVPHTDHAVWLPLVVEAYVMETGNVAFVDEIIESKCDAKTIFERIDAAIESLLRNLDSRHLSLIAQGDWCDPMNMVGHKGRGISGWLSMATIYAIRCWKTVCTNMGRTKRVDAHERRALDIRKAINENLWANDRYARGITDDGRRFGVAEDHEGRVFLNTQSWALLAGVSDVEQTTRLIETVERELQTPFGPMMLSPPFTEMVEDIGRVTQKHPGYAENGSIYNHATMFYIFALYQIRRSDLAFETLMKSIPGFDENDLRQRGQLPVFMPNYYRGAVDRFPRTAGRSSQLIHTGAASWCYRIVIEYLFGLRGTQDGLLVDPQLPASWQTAAVTRHFRDARFDFVFERQSSGFSLVVDGIRLDSQVIRDIQPGHRYSVIVGLPAGAA